MHPNGLGVQGAEPPGGRVGVSRTARLVLRRIGRAGAMPTFPAPMRAFCPPGLARGCRSGVAPHGA
ncbi:hypothetical protein ThimaDRAFT_4511 [Thiocapsa marina 5811]|uniref:Uncharacterized protein n=1 Tax=Thiocapsa marina 5811 TaxID=768671 RepID=F9UHV8_9GAMM|nr:hypothetical protein ThimaDRAFT_4511 [Thiocapsa marina 5811]